jgi:dihydroflavonol-4-reductase
MKIAITGASGHIGANICRLLLKHHHQLKVLVHKDRRALRGLQTEEIQGSILDPKVIEKLVEGVDAVIHLAAIISIGQKQNEKELVVNTEGTKNIVDACLKAGVKRFIHFSSIHAFNQFPLDETLDEKREGAGHSAFSYDRSKHESEIMVLEANKKGLACIILCPTAVFGPCDFKPSLLGQMFIRLKTGKIPAVIPGGFNWVDVRDVAEATKNALTQGKAGEKYLLGGKYLSIHELIQLIAQQTSIKKPVFKCPYFLALAGAPFFQSWAKLTRTTPLYTRMSIQTLRFSNRYISHKKAMKELDYSPRPLSESIADTYHWFKENDYYVEP